MEIKFHFSVSNEVNGVTEANLNDHFELMGISCLQPSLNKIKIYTDNAKMYQSFDFIQPAATGKNKFTNLIESFNLPCSIT